jgi:hypothetical protein
MAFLHFPEQLCHHRHLRLIAFPPRLQIIFRSLGNIQFIANDSLRLLRVPT